MLGLCLNFKRLLIITGLIFASACNSLSTQDGSLYNALGERAGIDEFIHTFADIVKADERINQHFLGLNFRRFEDKLAEQICFEAGGPCAYTGDRMQDVHVGMAITEAQFNALVEDLLDAMEQHQVSVAAQNQLVALLAPMRKNIIYQ